MRGGETISLGLLPDDPLPDEIVPGWSTARASGDDGGCTRSRCSMFPTSAMTLVQLVAPLGDVDARAVELRRRVIVVMVLDVIAGGARRVPARQDRHPAADPLRRDAD